MQHSHLLSTTEHIGAMLGRGWASGWEDELGAAHEERGSRAEEGTCSNEGGSFWVI